MWQKINLKVEKKISFPSKLDKYNVFILVNSLFYYYQTDSNEHKT